LQALNILALSCFNVGEPFIRQAKARGAKVWLLTEAKFLNKAWPRDLLEDVFAEPDASPLAHTINTVSFLSRKIRFDRIIPFDDIEVDVAASLREHLRMPGMGETQARVFRDKLAMRVKAREEGLPVPEFVHVLNHDEIHAFTQKVPAPWMLKPRLEAAATGIKKINSADELWPRIEALGDQAPFFLLERYLPGDVYHVDTIVTDKQIIFSEVHRNGVPPFDVTQGGMFTTSTVERGSDDEKRLRALNQDVLTKLGLTRGVAHAEFIKGKDGKFYFLEVGARVGGAHVSDVVEAATGVNLWREWANLEIDPGPYKLPETRREYAGLIQTLAKQEKPDTSAYADPEIVMRTGDKHHAGLIVRAPSYARIKTLLDDYAPRFARDFQASMPPREAPIR
jgi:hypothetical protein